MLVKCCSGDVHEGHVREHDSQGSRMDAHNHPLIPIGEQQVRIDPLPEERTERRIVIAVLGRLARVEVESCWGDDRGVLGKRRLRRQNEGQDTRHKKDPVCGRIF